MTDTKKSCYGCAYKQNVPGDAHIACSFNFKKAEKPLPQGDPHGIKNGWYSFPVNYDPNWMMTECQAYAEESDPEMTIEPFMSLISLMRG
ncbi:hypothetical protein COT94_00080 [Candidatus Falkowbacteria bacterium CG10_big_fil_rev_8_21_14_0_10_37_14]|uniref:Uncharacterized protein n=1 Tax=Candidatus Falkowbacteria bacterium CG10_big_fil_rev_8_21_14_0_10_37_14 TaxID=1974561 RepID=A0A2M6WUN2_9BACT|nr:MAG: hypothetical protein COT94_00080 [Candidatus Falkowbacteria bacterium CG10_big_fil_rev_8_21_14_0_10_37_14]